MKLLTINTHSLVEQDYDQKLVQLVAFLLQEQPDVIAMQEVNQSIEAAVVKPEAGYVHCTQNHIPLREDNHALQTARRLEQAGLAYQWTWVPAKIGYSRYDEGMALFSLTQPLEQVTFRYISRSSDYQNWQSRIALGAKIGNDWFYTVHMGWWDDPDEPFQHQWQVLQDDLGRLSETVWLMGDFNSPAELPRQGYELIQHSGWYDTYLLAREKDNGITVEEAIDGWRNQMDNPSLCGNGMRIDHIWCSRNVRIASSSVVLNRKNGVKISDHFGVMIATES